MVDKPQTPFISSAEQMAIVTVTAMQIRSLRQQGREATSVVLGLTEYKILTPYLMDAMPERLMGLEVKVDGDVGVRVDGDVGVRVG